MTNINEKYFDTLKQKKALEHLERVWKNKVCECCGHNKWTLAEDLVMPMIFTGGELQIGGPTYPQIMTICTNCGNTKFFNAVMAQVVPPAIKEEEKNE